MSKVSQWMYGLAIAMFAGLGGNGAMAGNYGAVTAIAALSNEASAFVGYASGAVAFCSGYPHPCQFYEDTPSSPVTAMDTSRGVEKGQYWVFVGYQNGDTYLCSFSHQRVCRPFDLKK